MEEHRAELDEVVGAAMERAHVPGVALGVIHPGGSFTAGYGITSVDHPQPVDGRTLFQIASITKTFTATLLMQLVERGQVDLDRSVRTYLPEFRLAHPDWTNGVTVRHLLTHRGGWDGDEFLVRLPRRLTIEGMIAELPRARLLFPPGTEWSYNNAGFEVAGRIAERLTEQDFDEAVRERVLEPAGLTSSCFRADETMYQRVALSHLHSERSGVKVMHGAGFHSGWEEPPCCWPEGGLISNAEDLLAWAEMVMSGGNGRAGRVVNEDTMGQMLLDASLAGNFADEVGLSWFRRERAGVWCFEHGGGTAGYVSHICLVPDLGHALVLLTNAPGGGIVQRDVLTWLFGKVFRLNLHAPEPIEELGAKADEADGEYISPFALQTLRATERGRIEVEYTAYPEVQGAWRPPAGGPSTWGFYARDRLVALAPEALLGSRAELGRSDDGRIAWFRSGGRLAPRRDRSTSA